MRIIEFDDAAVYDIESRSTDTGLHPDDVAGLRAAMRVLPPDALPESGQRFGSVTNRQLLDMSTDGDIEWELLRRVYDAAILMIWDSDTWTPEDSTGG